MSDGPEWTPEMDRAWLEMSLDATDATFPDYDEWGEPEDGGEDGGR